MPLDGLCLEFFPDFSHISGGRGGGWEGSVGLIVYREYIVFRGSDISCSLACAPSDRHFSVCIFWPGMRLDCSILSF